MVSRKGIVNTITITQNFPLFIQKVSFHRFFSRYYKLRYINSITYECYWTFKTVCDQFEFISKESSWIIPGVKCIDPLKRLKRGVTDTEISINEGLVSFVCFVWLFYGLVKFDWGCQGSLDSFYIRISGKRGKENKRGDG